MTSVLNPICRGLVGYISFLAPCTASPVYTEYLLYEPFYRIAIAQGYNVRAEVPIKYGPRKQGDHKRIDFTLRKEEYQVSIELKWIKGKTPDIAKDVEKLRTYNQYIYNSKGYVLLFGQYSNVFSAKPKYSGSYIDKGRKVVHWNSRKTHYACNWYRFT